MLSYKDLMNAEFPGQQRQHEKLVRKFMANYPGHPLNQKEMAELLEIKESRLSNLISRSRTTGTYGKTLQGKDVIHALLKGVYNIMELGLDTRDEKQAALKKIGLMFQDPELAEMIYEANQLNLDPKEILGPAIKAIKKQRGSNIIRPTEFQKPNGE